MADANILDVADKVALQVTGMVTLVIWLKMCEPFLPRRAVDFVFGVV